VDRASQNAAKAAFFLPFTALSKLRPMVQPAFMVETVHCLKNLPLLDMPHAFPPLDPTASKNMLIHIFMEKYANKAMKTAPIIR